MKRDEKDFAEFPAVKAGRFQRGQAVEISALGTGGKVATGWDWEAERGGGGGGIGGGGWERGGGGGGGGGLGGFGGGGGVCGVGGVFSRQNSGFSHLVFTLLSSSTHHLEGPNFETGEGRRDFTIRDHNHNLMLIQKRAYG